jgi:sugar O-acyltransferase (sialic acid O-acetyltransferase NeuD family)
VHDVGTEEGTLDVAAFAADEAFIESDSYHGRPLVPVGEVEKHYPPESHAMLTVIGYKRMRDRRSMFERARTLGYDLVNYISKYAIVYEPVEMGQNNIIFGGTYIGPNGCIGDNNVIRPNVYVGHDVKMEDHVFLGPGCTIGGNCFLGSLSYVGIGATVVDGIALAQETLVGAGGVLLQNSERYGTYVGVPARKITEHEQTGIEISK